MIDTPELVSLPILLNAKFAAGLSSAVDRVGGEVEAFFVLFGVGSRLTGNILSK